MIDSIADVEEEAIEIVFSNGLLDAIIDTMPEKIKFRYSNKYMLDYRGCDTAAEHLIRLVIYDELYEYCLKNFIDVVRSHWD